MKGTQIESIFKRLLGVAAAVVIVGLSVAFAGADETKLVSPPTAAVICDVANDKPAGAMASLLELKLGESKTVKLLDREAIKAVLGEQELAIMFSPEGGKQRIAVGQQLRASLLIMLRPVEDRPNQVTLVVSETARGLRLLNRRVTLGAQTEVEAAALVQLVKEAVQRAAAPITDIVAVPPFVNNDLIGGDSLKHAYARLVEQAVTADAGVEVVDLEEARAIATELKLSSGKDRIERNLPIYVLGQFRNAGNGTARTTRITLEVRRGETGWVLLESEPMAPDAVAEYLRKNVAKSLKDLLGREVTEQATETEVAQLAGRADLFINVGDQTEALNLLWAAELLRPMDWKLRRRLVMLGIEAVNATWPADQRFFGGRRVANAEEFNTFKREAVRLYESLTIEVETMIRGDLFAANALPPALSESEYGDLFAAYWGIFPITICFHNLDAQHCPAELCEAHRRIREALISSLEQQPFEKQEVDWRAKLVFEQLWIDGEFYGETDEQTLGQILRAFRASPDPMTMPIPTLSSTRVVGSKVPVHTWESYQLDRDADVDRLERELVKAGLHPANEEKKALAAADGWMNDQSERENMRGWPMLYGRPKKVPQTQPSAFRVTEVNLVDPDTGLSMMNPKANPTGYVRTWSAGGPGFDIITNSKALYQLTAPLKLTALYKCKNEFIREPSFDGQYIWQGSNGGGGPLVAVIEPVSGKVVEFTKEDGIPEATGDFLVLGMTPGRACMIGCMGESELKLRTWAGVLELKADGTKSFKIVIEAKSTDTETQPPDMAFRPREAMLVAVGDPKNINNHRVLVTRFRLGMVVRKWVLIDLVRGTIEYPNFPAWNFHMFKPSADIYPVNGEMVWIEPDRATAITQYVRKQFPEPDPIVTWPGTAIAPAYNWTNPLHTSLGWFLSESADKGPGTLLWYAPNVDERMRPIGRTAVETKYLRSSNVLGLRSGNSVIEIDPASIASTQPDNVLPPPVTQYTGKLTTLPDGRRQFVNSVGMTFVELPAGKFMMGSPQGEAGRMNIEFQHEVVIANPFFIATTETTREQWQGLEPGDLGQSGQWIPPGDPTMPMTGKVPGVILNRFCSDLNKLERNHYRLPTEAEWEYACRAGSTTAYCFGDDAEQLSQYATFSPAGKWGEADGVTRVGSHKPNAWGVYDMHGNVAEWCSDNLEPHPLFVHSRKPFAVELKSELPYVIRGGSWADEPFALRSATRRWMWQRQPYFGGRNMIGFRLVVELTNPPTTEKRDPPR